jgi:hypothetical protein
VRGMQSKVSQRTVPIQVNETRTAAMVARSCCEGDVDAIGGVAARVSRWSRRLVMGDSGKEKGGPIRPPLKHAREVVREQGRQLAEGSRRTARTAFPLGSVTRV